MIRSLLFILSATFFLNASTAEILCIKVIDGDSFHGQRADGNIVKYRIFGIDCPERDQPYGDSATTYLSSRILNRVILVDSISSDPYGRTVCKAYEKATSKKNRFRKDLAIQLLERGYAWWSKRYAPNESGYMTAEANAKRANKGLWSQENPIAPWKWRKLLKKERQALNKKRGH